MQGGWPAAWGPVAKSAAGARITGRPAARELATGSTARPAAGRQEWTPVAGAGVQKQSRQPGRGPGRVVRWLTESIDLP